MSNNIWISGLMYHPVNYESEKKNIYGGFSSIALVMLRIAG